MVHSLPPAQLLEHAQSLDALLVMGAFSQCAPRRFHRVIRNPALIMPAASLLPMNSSSTINWISSAFSRRARPNISQTQYTVGPQCRS